MTEPHDITPDSKVLVISVAAKMAGMHPQTLRQYDRLGLVEAARTPGGGRRYSVRDVAMLREIQRLSQEDGVNLAGIKRIIALEHQVSELRGQLTELARHLEEARAHLNELEALAGPFALRRMSQPGNALMPWPIQQYRS